MNRDLWTRRLNKAEGKEQLQTKSDNQSHHY